MVPIKQFFDNPHAQSKLGQLVPRGTDAARLMRMALMSISKTPKLQLCTPESLFLSVCDAAALGLDCGGSLGMAYLVPYGTKCTLVVGYRGMVQLCRQSGEIAAIEARVVRTGDEFDFEFGIKPIFRHRPSGNVDDQSITHAWAMARFKDQSYQLDVMTREEIEKIRTRSKASGAGPWITDYAEMCKKTVVRRLCKMLPMTPEAAEAIDKLDTAEFDLRPTPKSTIAFAPRSIEKAQVMADSLNDEPGANDGFEDDLSNAPNDFADPHSGSSTALIEETITPNNLYDSKNDKKPHNIRTADGTYYGVFSDTLWGQIKEIGMLPMIVGYEQNGNFKTVKEVRKA